MGSKVAIYIMFMGIKFAATYLLAILGWIFFALKVRAYRRAKDRLRAARAQLAIHIAAEAIREERKRARMSKVRGRARKGSGGSGSSASGTPPSTSTDLDDRRFETPGGRQRGGKKYHFFTPSPPVSTSQLPGLDTDESDLSGTSTPETTSPFDSPLIEKRPILGLFDDITKIEKEGAQLGEQE